MTAWAVSAAVSVGLSILVGWALPALAMKRLLPVLEDSRQLVTNYRGRRIPTGLGLVWLVWVAGVAVAGLFPAWVLSSPFSDATAHLPLLLVAGSVAFGLTDDVFGAGDAKGFKGHLSALAHGRLTTGGLKLLGIGALALAVAPAAASFANANYPMYLGAGAGVGGKAVAGLVCVVLVIALSANFVNLADLRPGRALKTYTLLAGLGVALTAWGSWQEHVFRVSMKAGVDPGGQVPTGSAALIWIAGLTLCVLVLALGPVLAVWRYDLGERAMLGDAGANAMGVLAGFLLVWRSPLWLIVVLAIVLLALNLASERFSFSRVIERVPALRWADGLGRLPAGSGGTDSGQDGDDGTRTGGSAAEGDDARRDGRS